MTNLKHLKKRLQRLRNKRVLITCGPTWVALDRVRVISNLSSGKLGRLVAAGLANAGARVTLLQGQIPGGGPIARVTIKPFAFFDELKDLLKNELPRHDAVLHAAAIADYRPVGEAAGKIRSGKKQLVLRLKPTEKLINAFKRRNKKIFVVGFKLETKLGKARAGARSLIKRVPCDMAVANTLEEGYEGCIIDARGNTIAQARSREAMAQALVSALRKHL